MKSILHKKKAQLDIMTFIVIVIGLIIVGPIILKLMSSITGGLGTNLGSMSTQANDSINYIQTTANTWFDTTIVIFIFINLILLFIFSFMVDAHPVFLILYIISAFFSIVILPYLADIPKAIYGSSQFSDAVTNLPFTSFILNHISIITLAVIFITGVIIYAKWRGGGGSMGGGPLG